MNNSKNKKQSIIKRLVKYFKQLKFRYLCSHSIVRIKTKSDVSIGKNTRICNSRIFVSAGNKLTIGENVLIKNTNMNINGEVYIGKNTIIEKGYQPSKINIIVKGKMICSNNCRIRSAKIWIRFGGNLQIGSFTNINEETEIRVDESIAIGSYNQISYKCIIWDTNTHNIYSDEERRKLSEKYYPLLGYEYEKPKTKPVFIGNDCWIGREVAILKGVKINNSCVIGFRTTLSNCEIKNNNVVVPKNEIVIFPKSVRISHKI